MRKMGFKVCSGPGCKAWDSIELARDLKCILESQEVEFEVELVSCMNSCGGGISVKSLERNKHLYKFRTLGEALELLGNKGLLPVANV